MDACVIVCACIIYTHRPIIQKVLGRNYILAPVPWRVLGRKSLLPLWSRRLCTRFSLNSRNCLASLIAGKLPFLTLLLYATPCPISKYGTASAAHADSKNLGQ